MIGKTILHYRILKKLGEGGMGVIYKAEDTKLKRDVAIKFLPRHIAASDEERKRFKIEAQAAAALNHHNIAHVYAIEEVDDEMFIVMEYIDGRELKSLFTNHLSLDTVLDYATQIASGMQAAHTKGIIHRDIKSSNIMVTKSGQIKIMDFGLAKVHGGAQVTKVGTTLGTAAFMSPERAYGGEADHRSDIWAFGVVLYQMLTGRLPFPGDYEQAVIYSIINEDPIPIAQLRPDVPETLQRIVDKALAKEPHKRFQSVQDLLADLTNISEKRPAPQRSKNRKVKSVLAAFAGLAGLAFLAFFFLYPQKENSQIRDGSSESSIHRIAVLPFANLRENPETDFLGLALADEIIGDLTYIKSVLVRPASSVRPYQRQVVDAPTAGKELGVDFILAGSYLKEGGIIRLDVELVDVKLNEMVWRDEVEAEYENAFKLQDIVAEKVLDGLKVQFSQEERQRMQSDVSRDPLAYEYYLRALSYPYSNEGHQLAVSMLKKSIELDSTFAPAWDELGFRKQQISYYVVGKSQQIYEAEHALSKALSLNSNSLRSLGQLTGIYTELGKAGEAVETARRALAINPNSPDNHFFLGYVYRYTGFLEEAEREMQIALKFDPGNAKFRSIGVTYIYLGKYEQALDGLGLDSGSPYSLGWQGQVYLRLGKDERALDLLNRVIEMEPEGILGFWTAAMKAHLLSNPEMGLTGLQKQEDNIKDPEQFYNVANLYGLLGYKNQCIRALNKAVAGGFYCYPLFLTDSFLDSVRDEPEFQEVLAEAKSKHNAFAEKFF